MHSTPADPRPARLKPGGALGAGLGACAAFHLAQLSAVLSPLILLFLFALFQLGKLASARQGFYAGLALGLAIYAPHLAFFWTIFGWPAVLLWGILAFWLGLFVALARSARHVWGLRVGAILLPFLWTGLEYFRSELYYLRFSWLSVGYAFAESPRILSATGLGVYGIGFLLSAVAAAAALLSRRGALAFLGVSLLGLGLVQRWPEQAAAEPGLPLKVAGVQLEFPAPQEVPAALDRLVRRHPEADVLVLSEYTFDGPIPERVRAWCRRHGRHLVAGGKWPLAGDDFCNTVFVVGPGGDIVFQQVKSVPIQFFKDGRPAESRATWDSPWGRLGLCICYDLSYRRVVDDLVRQGARALIVPTMDVADWGEAQHRLHGRVAPVRAAEYGVPIFRLCSSGISQVVDARGQVHASAPCPGQGETLGGTLDLRRPGRLPADRYLGPASAAISGLAAAAMLGARAAGRSGAKSERPAGGEDA